MVVLWCPVVAVVSDQRGGLMAAHMVIYVALWGMCSPCGLQCISHRLRAVGGRNRPGRANLGPVAFIYIFIPSDAPRGADRGQISREQIRRGRFISVGGFSCLFTKKIIISSI